MAGTFTGYRTIVTYITEIALAYIWLLGNAIKFQEFTESLKYYLTLKHFPYKQPRSQIGSHSPSMSS